MWLLDLREESHTPEGRYQVQPMDTGTVKSRNARRDLVSMKSKLSLLSLLFLSAVWIMPYGMVHASTVATALPGVKSGDNATYVFTNLTFQTNNATAYPTSFIQQQPILTLSRDTAIRITNVSGANVTYSQTVYSKDGTVLISSITNVDVQTQDFCFVGNPYLGGINQTYCATEQTPSLLLASGLQAPDFLGANPSLKLNETVPGRVLGFQRMVNIYNRTDIIDFCAPVTGANACSNETLITSFAWDQASGLLVSYSVSMAFSSIDGYSQATAVLVMVSTNIFPTPVADFSLVSNPSSVTVQGGGRGSSTVTLTSENGFAGAVALRVATSSSQLSCSLSSSNLTLAASNNSSLAISCSGSQGTYTVTVIGTAGNLSHSTILAFTILHGHRHHP